MHFKALAYRLLGSACLSLVAPLLAPGCTAKDEDSGVSSVEEEALSEADGVVTESAACQVPGTLAYHVAQAAPSGRFDYDPPGGLVERVKGRYRDRSGRFRWKERFIDGSYIHKQTVRGQATAFDTQQSLAYQIETTDVLGAVSVTEVEESWDECAVERRFRALGGTEADWRTHSGSYDGTTYTYVEEQVPYRNSHRLPIITVYGERYADQSFIEDFEGGGYPNGPEYYQTRTGDGLGNEHLYWEINFGDGYTFGTIDSSADGTRHHLTRQLSDGDGCTETWRDQTIGYDGYGAGTSQLCVYLSSVNAGQAFGLEEDNGEEEEEEEEEEEYPVPVMCTLSITPEQCVETCEHGAVNVYPSCL